MSDRIEPFTVTVPANTAQASFQTTNLPFNAGRVDLITILVPPGPSGLVGFRIAHNGQPIIPYTGDRWFIVDNAKFDWDTDGYPTGEGWEIQAYNTDVYDHDVFLWFHVTELRQEVDAPLVPVDIQPVITAEDDGPAPEDILDFDESVM